MPRSDTRHALIQTGSALIARQGFNDTGIMAIVEAAGVPKGSFYHYFASKEDFGLAVIDAFAADHKARLVDILGDQNTAPLERIARYFAAGLEDMIAYDFTRGCPIGNLGQELAGQNEIFRQRLDVVFNDWQGVFARCLGQAQAAGQIASHWDIPILAEFLLASWEGATLRAKVTRSVAPMEAFVTIFFQHILKIMPA